jgi:CRISPR-associated protein Cas4
VYETSSVTPCIISLLPAQSISSESAEITRAIEAAAHFRNDSKATNAEKDIVVSIGKHDDAPEISRKYIEQYALALREAVSKYLPSLRALNIDPETAYEGAFSTLLAEASMRSRNTISFFEKTNFVGEELWEKLTPKILSEVRVESEKLGLIGIIDQVHDYGDYAIPVELKTGKMPKVGVWPGHRIQASAYALMLSEMQGKPVGKTIVHYLDGNDKREIVMNPFMRDEIVMLVLEIQELLSNTLLPEYCESTQKCNSCGLRKECYDAKLMQSLLTSARDPKEKQLLLE